MDDRKIDAALFAKMPKSVRALNKQAHAERRQKKREQWAAENPENWRVRGKVDPT